MTEPSIDQSGLSAREAMLEVLQEVRKKHADQFASLEQWMVRLVGPLEETIRNHEKMIALKDEEISVGKEYNREQELRIAGHLEKIESQRGHIRLQAKVVTDQKLEIENHQNEIAVLKRQSTTMDQRLEEACVKRNLAQKQARKHALMEAKDEMNELRAKCLRLSEALMTKENENMALKRRNAELEVHERALNHYNIVAESKRRRIEE
jgi:primase-polymerase (primpol)-like protein